MTAIDGSRDQHALATRVEAATAARLEGKTWEEVARLVGYASKGAAYTAVMQYQRRLTAATAAAFREEANARTAERMAMLADVLNDLDVSLELRLRAHAEFTRLEARHARLNGADAPIQVALSAGVAAELEDALAEVESVIRGEVESVTDEPIGDEGSEG